MPADPELYWAAQHVGDDDATVTGSLAGARELAWFNPGCEVVRVGREGSGIETERFYGPETEQDFEELRCG